jgi:integrase/recombinase XerC
VTSASAGASVRCNGKGRKYRAVPLTHATEAVLKVWMAERAGRRDEPLFPTRTGRRLSVDAVERLLRKYAATASTRCPSIRPDRLHPHILRHSCAMSLLQAGVDTAVIALWLGHADIRSTNVYLHADMTIKQRALDLTTPASTPPGRYRPSDSLLAFLEGL